MRNKQDITVNKMFLLWGLSVPAELTVISYKFFITYFILWKTF
jgi:hypothetical protein